MPQWDTILLEGFHLSKRAKPTGSWTTVSAYNTPCSLVTTGHFTIAHFPFAVGEHKLEGATQFGTLDRKRICPVLEVSVGSMRQCLR